MFQRFFNPDNWFFRITGSLLDLVLLSLLWLLGCLPLFTIGPSSAALYDTAVRTLRLREESAPYRRFLRVFRREFKVGALVSLLVVAAAAALYFLTPLLTLAALSGRAGTIFYYAFLVVFLLIFGIVSYFFPVLSRFTFPPGGLILTCCKLAFAHPAATLCLGVVTAASTWICVRFWWPVLFVPAGAALLSAQVLEPIFRPYMEQQQAQSPEQPPL